MSDGSLGFYLMSDGSSVNFNLLLVVMVGYFVVFF
jgi:hypothetical protein